MSESKPVGRFTMTIAQFRQAAGLGWFGDRHAELIDGEAFYVERSEEQRDCREKLHRALREPLASAGWDVLVQQHVELGETWLPCPDLAVCRGGTNRDRPAGVGDVALIVEFRDGTSIADRGPRYVQYARSKVASYWLVDVGQRLVRVFGGPDPRGDPPHYGSGRTHRATDQLPLVIGGQELGRVDLKQVLPAGQGTPEVTPAAILRLMRAEPFVPFTIRMATGEAIPVASRAVIAYAGGRTASVILPGDKVEIVDLTRVLRIEVDDATGGREVPPAGA